MKGIWCSREIPINTLYAQPPLEGWLPPCPLARGWVFNQMTDAISGERSDDLGKTWRPVNGNELTRLILLPIQTLTGYELVHGAMYLVLHQGDVPLARIIVEPGYGPNEVSLGRVEIRHPEGYWLLLLKRPLAPVYCPLSESDIRQLLLWAAPEKLGWAFPETIELLDWLHRS